MRFLLDQSTDARLLAYLHREGHDALRVGRDLPPGLADTDVLAQAAATGRILVTDDRDFGELVFRRRQRHVGVIYLRLGPGADLSLKTERLGYVLAHNANQLDQFLVVTRHDVRVRAQAEGAP
jgi:predicted nuclease of predicted toxin-antitoxin system